MASDTFHFKRFSVLQDRTPMKVGTDGILLGAWAAVEQAKTILDVGTGTGLLALMAAQRNEQAAIVAIDVDAHAVQQALGNVAQSPWPTRIGVMNVSFQDWLKQEGKAVDHIICNPPYYEVTSLRTAKAMSTARHTWQLEHEELARGAAAVLSEKGLFSLILPAEEGQRFVSLAQDARLQLQRKTVVFPMPGKRALRWLLAFNREGGDLEENELYLQEHSRANQYTDAFRRLTRDFYLHH